MSVGEASIGLNLGIARLDSDTREAERLLNRISRGVIANSQQAEKAIAQLTSAGITEVDRLQRSFNTLNIKTGLNIEKEKAQITAAFDNIKNSGVASANEITRANAAMKAQLDRLDGGNVMKSHTEGMSGFSLASVAAIAKIQILYSLINNVMSAIGSIPTTAIDAIENYKSSLVTNAALITSMQGGTKDVGKAYQENKVYAEAVEKVLIKMDNETVASYAQLQLMNRAFVQQGVILDINNKKAVDGYRNIAQAVAVIAQASPNPNMQFQQEIRGLMSGEMKAGNMLLAMLEGIDKDIVAKIKRWKEAGTIPENIGPLLAGFAAAQGDIESMWATVKSTMATIRDEILRGGLAPAFGEIVAMMKEVSKYAEANKEKIQAFLREGFADAKAVAKFIWEWRDGFVALGKASIFLAITTGISSVIEKLKLMDATFKSGALYKALTNPVTAGVILAAYGGYKVVSQANENDRLSADAATANSIAGNVSAFGNKGPQFNAQHMGDFYSQFPMAGPELLALAKSRGAASLVPSNLSGGSDIYKLKLDLEAIKNLQEGAASVVVPKVKSGGGKPEEYGPARWNTFASEFNSFLNGGEEDAFLRKLDAIQDKADKLKVDFQSMGAADRAASNRQDKNFGGTVGAINFARAAEEERAINEQAFKEFEKWHNEELRLYAREQQAKKDAIVEAKKAALEKKALAELEIENQLLIIDYQEKMNQLSGPEALAARIPLEQKRADIQKDFLATMNRQSDPQGWMTQNKAYYNDMLKVNSDLEKAFEQTAKGGFTSAMKAYADSAMNLGNHVKGFTTTVFKSMEDALVSFVTKGKIDFKSLADSIITDMVRIAIQQSVTGPLAKVDWGGMFGSLFASAATPALSSSGGYNLGYGGSVTTPSSGYSLGFGGSVSPASSGGYSLMKSAASGYDIPAGVNPVVQTHAQEMILPDKYANVIRNMADGGGGGNTNLTVNIVNQSGQQVKGRDGGTHFDGKQMIKTIILEALDTDHTFRNAVRG